jgi:tetratricopeptide (TPR) repeat protein
MRDSPALLTRRPRPWRRLVAVGLGVSILVGLAVAAWGELNVRRDASAVRLALAARRPDRAAEPLARWLRARPRSAEAHFLQARMHFAAGDLDAATRELDRAAELGHDPVAISRLRGFLLVLTRRYAEAEPFLVAARDRITRPDPELDEALARCFLQTYQLKSAGTVLRRWMQDAPEDPRPHLWMIEVARRNDARPAEIVKLYQAALEIDPDQDAARLGLAEALWGAERHAEARAEYRAYIARHPDDPAGHLGAGRVALALEDLAAATRDFDEALRLDPENIQALRERAGLALRLRDYPTTLELSERAAKLDPLDPTSLFRQGQALVHLGRADEARALQQRAVRLREEITALDELRFKLKLKPRDYDLRARIAGWFLDHGQEAEGLRWARTVLSVAPDHTPTNRLLAEYYEKTGQAGLASFYRLQVADNGKDL